MMEVREAFFKISTEKFFKHMKWGDFNNTSPGYYSEESVRGTQCLTHSRCSIKASSSLSYLPQTGQGNSIPHEKVRWPHCHLNHPLPSGQQHFRLTPTAWLGRVLLLGKQTIEGEKKQHSEAIMP